MENLHAEIDGKPILKGRSLAANAGAAPAIMEPNGAGEPAVNVETGRR